MCLIWHLAKTEGLRICYGRIQTAGEDTPRSGAGGGTHRFRVYHGASEMNTDLVELRSEDSLTDLDERTTCYFLGCMHWLLQE